MNITEQMQYDKIRKEAIEARKEIQLLKEMKKDKATLEELKEYKKQLKGPSKLGKFAESFGKIQEFCGQLECAQPKKKKDLF